MLFVLESSELFLENNKGEKLKFNFSYGFIKKWPDNLYASALKQSVWGYLDSKMLAWTHVFKTAFEKYALDP